MTHDEKPNIQTELSDYEMKVLRFVVQKHVDKNTVDDAELHPTLVTLQARGLVEIGLCVLVSIGWYCYFPTEAGLALIEGGNSGKY